MQTQTDTNTPVLPDPTVEPTVSVERAGAIFGISRASAYGAVHDGSIPSIRLGRRLVVPSAAILRMLATDATAYPVDDAA
jgi:hypothetical protein